MLGRHAVAGLVLVALVLAVYWPGLAGGFVFDDFVNLNALGRYGAVSDLGGALRYLTSGAADPTGRPVAMLSFLLDARDWPADPAPFKLHNVCLHAANGLLCAALFHRLGLLAGLARSRVIWVAWCGALLWALHPLWVSTTLYVVQRHAMLAAFFVLLGLHAWLQARCCAERGESRKAVAWGLLGIPVFFALAASSKPTGALLPVLLAALELTVLAHRPSPRVLHLLRTWLVYLPALAVASGLVLYGALASDTVYARRDFTLGERLLTQSRVLWRYLGELCRPSLTGGSVFADGFTISRGWIQPASTLAGVIALLALAVLAIWARRRWPVLSAAVLFFLVGHLVESTVLPLEMYFEHRNYLPSILLFWAAAVGVAALPVARAVRAGAVVVALAVLSLLTYAQAQVWGNPLRQAEQWVAMRPDSSRAQAHWANLALAVGQQQKVVSHLHPLVMANPRDLQLSLSLIGAQCRQGTVPPSTLQAVDTGLRTQGPGDALAYRWLSGLLLPQSTAACAGLPLQIKQALLDAALAGPGGDGVALARAADLRGRLALAQGNCQMASAAMGQQLRASLRPEHLLESTMLLATHCPADVALRRLRCSREFLHLHRQPAPAGMPRVRDWLMARQGYWDGIFGELEMRLLQAAAGSGQGMASELCEQSQ